MLTGRTERLRSPAVVAALSLTDDDAEILLEDLEAEGRVARREAGSGPMWAAPAAGVMPEPPVRRADSANP